MSNFKISVYALKNGRIESSYVNPITRKRTRKRFDSQKEALRFKESVEREYVSKNYAYFSEAFVMQAIEQHLKDYPESKLTERKNVFRSFCDYFGKYKVKDLTRQELKSWFDKIQAENNYSERTLNTIKSQINWLFRSLVADGLLEDSPLDKIKFRRIVPPRRPRVVLSVAEVLQILENAKSFSPDGLFPFLATVAHTGARRGEVLRLTREDIDFSTGLIHIKKSKNGRERFIRLSPTIRTILKTHIDTHVSGPLFTNEHGTKLDSNKELARLMDKFKAFFPMDKDWGCHSLRHSFAYNFLMKGREMYQLQSILGHQSVDVTVDLYGQLKAQDVPCPSPYENDEE